MRGLLNTSLLFYYCCVEIDTNCGWKPPFPYSVCCYSYPITAFLECIFSCSLLSKEPEINCAKKTCMLKLLYEGKRSVQFDRHRKVAFPLHFIHSLLRFTASDMSLCSECWIIQMFFMLKIRGSAHRLCCILSSSSWTSVGRYYAAMSSRCMNVGGEGWESCMAHVLMVWEA